jgi:hypothetical protein
MVAGSFFSWKLFPTAIATLSGLANETDPHPMADDPSSKRFFIYHEVIGIIDEEQKLLAVVPVL